MALLHASYFEQIRRLREDSLTHVVTLSRTTMVRDPDTGEYVEGPREVAVVPGLLTRPNEAMRSVAASSGTAVDWVLKLRVGDRAEIGDLASVQGETDEEPWTRVVEITGDLGLVGKINKRLTAIDSEINVEE